MNIPGDGVWSASWQTEHDVGCDGRLRMAVRTTNVQMAARTDKTRSQYWAQRNRMIPEPGLLPGSERPCLKGVLHI
jgi:hypothetical protein